MSDKILVSSRALRLEQSLKGLDAAIEGWRKQETEAHYAIINLQTQRRMVADDLQLLLARAKPLLPKNRKGKK